MLHKRYVIMQTIGQGGMGAVYKAQDMTTQKLSAVKEMSLSMVPDADREQAIHNFRVEAAILARLSHPNLPAFTDFFSEDARYFLVMEYVEGQTLEELLENKGPFPERRVLNWARQLCEVLEYLHGQRPSIIFRDMKPGNIMLMHGGRVKLIDFGIARFFRNASSQDTQLLGTPGFAPPEQYGKAQTDERSDIYSLAMTLYQLMTNKLSEKGFGLKDVHANNPQISPGVARALERATSLAPEDRYQDVASFRRALLGANTFVFDNGQQASTPEELAELCAVYPEEAANHLFASEIEAWLHEIGENDLARATRRIRSTSLDNEEVVESFLQLLMGPDAHTRSYLARTMDDDTSNAGQGTGSMSAIRPNAGRSRPTRSSRGWLPRRSTPDVLVSPRTIDFGQIYPGLSAPISLSIQGSGGIFVRGTISVTEPWIIVDATSFDAMSTRVNVRVDSMNMHQVAGTSHYSGSIIVSPEGEEQEIEVKVLVDILDFGDTFSDEEDDTPTISANGMLMAPQMSANGSGGGAGTSTISGTRTSATGGISFNTGTYNKDREKYGAPGANGWDPLQATARQRLGMGYGLTFFAALMMTSLLYTLISQLPPVL
ncbi:MAG TPA: serine/threonine-protein kinase, partial [Ktedonobacteraceae bacterium]|nr:serine/threonine-protein kinase [Ktedonobacteraceae bacterium]